MTEFTSKTPDKHNSNKTIETISCFDNNKNKINDEAKYFYKTNKNNSERIQDLKTFLGKQEGEKIALENKYIEGKNEVIKETKVEKFKLYLYQKGGIKENLQENTWENKFRKGFIDSILGIAKLGEDFINADKEDLLENILNVDIKEVIKNGYDKLTNLNKDDLIAKMKQVWNDSDGIYIIGGIMSGLGPIGKSKNIVEGVEELGKGFKKEQNIKNIITDIKKDKFETLELIGTKEYFNKQLKGLSDKLGLEKSITIKNYIDNGANGAVFEIPGTNMLVKIPREDFKGNFSTEINKHIEMFNIHKEWETKITQEYGFDNLDKIKIPYAKNQSGYYLMENISNYSSLESFLSREMLKEKLGRKLDGINLEQLNFTELNLLREKSGIGEFDYKTFKRGIIEEKDFEVIKSFFSYMNHSGLGHCDIHEGNIMLSKGSLNNGKGIYAIDFGTFGEVGFDGIIKDRGNLSIKGINETIKMTPKDEMFDFKYPDLVRIEKILKPLIKK